MDEPNSRMTDKEKNDEGAETIRAFLRDCKEGWFGKEPFSEENVKALLQNVLRSLETEFRPYRWVGDKDGNWKKVYRK